MSEKKKNDRSFSDGTDDATSHNSQITQSSKKRVWKNVIVISLVFMLNYISFSGLSVLQSSLHVQEDHSVICTSIRDTSLISSLFLPELLIQGIGYKWT